ncbi:MAG TPA: peptide-methionine (S)-S-oxide reductase MsrA [Patescibacteria group bacterium]|nr:peptide-methionine (S)-S-oxide reductase MsrA [Patescibacteria group bacterium]
MKKAVFGAGCFWHVEEAFRCVKGVAKTIVGYMGGDEKKYPNPSYEQVSSDKTGFVEVCYVEYNPDEINYENLLKVFWKIHNPTQLNRQGPDVGTQYKSVIFYFDSEQEKTAKKSKETEQKKHHEKIVTEIRKAEKFYKAEEYHQNYLMKRGLKTCKI